jgi:hypothetical protein
MLTFNVNNEWISKVWRCQTKRPLIEEGQTMKWQKEKGQSKTLHRTLKVEHHDPHWQPWVNCCWNEISIRYIRYYVC